MAGAQAEPAATLESLEGKIQILDWKPELLAEDDEQKQAAF
jgi:hypothetical protein